MDLVLKRLVGFLRFTQYTLTLLWVNTVFEEKNKAIFQNYFWTCLELSDGILWKFITIVWLSTWHVLEVYKCTVTISLKNTNFSAKGRKALQNFKFVPFRVLDAILMLSCLAPAVDQSRDFSHWWYTSFTVHMCFCVRTNVRGKSIDEYVLVLIHGKLSLY